jgi:hypothetical protein
LLDIFKEVIGQNDSLWSLSNLNSKGYTPTAKNR